MFVTGINHPRDENNLLMLVRQGHERVIAGMVILTEPAYIQAIPDSVFKLADRLGVPLLEQPYLLAAQSFPKRLGLCCFNELGVIELLAAKRLNVHRNTLSYRLQRIEALTACSFSNPHDRLNISVALLIWRLSSPRSQP